MVASLVASCVLASGLAAGPADPLPRKPWLGAQVTAVDGGVRVGSVLPESTAMAAGLKAEDVIVAINGQAVTQPAQVAPLIGALLPGAKAVFQVRRGEQELTLEAPARSRPEDHGDTYRTIYDDVLSNGHRIRMFVTRPTRATGRLPVLFIIQGIGYVSAEQPLSGAAPYSRIAKAFNDAGYVTVRVDKPGLGDSEGGPANRVTFPQEVDAFKQALLKTKSYDFVDPDKVIIFGHSMGGCQGPIVASEVPVLGLAVYGTVVRTWHEYTMEMFRNQASLAGAKASTRDGAARNTVAALHLLFNEGLSPDEVAEKHPQWADAVRMLVPDGYHFSGIGLDFWRGCYAENYAAYWEKLDTNVLSIYGECDFVAERIDHPLIAEIVNREKPGKAEFIEIPASDHAFRNVATKRESQEYWSRGGREMNPAIIEVLLTWANRLTGKS
ncbi:MAG: alpha/beta fold hydrolase [Fimbriimonadaceae bacterium]